MTSFMPAAVSDSVGYACPAGGDRACSFLNTFASDLNACTVGTCLPTDTGEQPPVADLFQADEAARSWISLQVLCFLPSNKQLA